MKVRILAFSDQGLELAQRLAVALQGSAQRCGGQTTLAGWTAQAFADADALVFVGAAGIAVRAIAPHIKSKVCDPAVVVVDECARFAVPVLSGHLGGANHLARRIGAICGAVPVITTATDANGLFAVDEWAKKQGCRIGNPQKIKTVSGKLLRGETVRVKSAWPIQGDPPYHVVQTDGDCDVLVDIKKYPDPDALCVVPKIAVLGVGCRRGTDRDTLEKEFHSFLDMYSVWEEAIALVCSIDLKKEEQGLIEFCMVHHFKFETLSANELNRINGEFSASAFVQSVTGVDNVCERSALAGCGESGSLFVKKYANNGITMALAIRPFVPDWSFYDE